MKYPRFIAPAGLLALAPALSLAAQGAAKDGPEVTAALALLAERTAPLVAGQAAPSVQDPASTPPAPESMALLVQRILNGPSPQDLKVLGPAAAPELCRIADGYDLVRLIQWNGSNAFEQLARALPTEALKYLIKLEAQEPAKFEALLRFNQDLPSDLMRPLELTPELKEALVPLVDASVTLDGLDLEKRMRTAVHAYKFGVPSAKAEALILAHPVLAHRYDEYSPGRPLHELVYPAGRPLPPSLDIDYAVDLLRDRPTASLVRELAGLGDMEIATLVFDAMKRFYWDKTLPTDDVIKVVGELLNSTDPTLKSSAFGQVRAMLTSKDVRLTDEQFTELVVKTYGADWRAVNGNNMEFLREVAGQLHNRPELSEERLRRIFHASFSSVNRAFASVWWNPQAIRFRHVSQAYSFAQAALAVPDPPYDAFEPLASAIEAMPASSPERAAWTLRYLRLGDPETLEQRVEDICRPANSSMQARESKLLKRDALFDALAVSDGIQAARWLTTFDSGLARLAFEGSQDWVDAAPALRAVAENPEEPLRMRLFAAGSLISRNEATEGGRQELTAQLIALSQDADQASLVNWLDEASTQGSPEARRSWARITLALLQDPRVPDAAASELRMLVSPSDDPAARAVVTEIFEAAAARQKQSATFLRFADIAYFALEWMEHDPALVRPDLLKPWFEHSIFRSQCIQVMAASGQPELVDLVIEEMFANLQAAGATFQRKGTAGILFSIPGDAHIERLLAFALGSTDQEFVKYVESTVSEKLRLREAAARWSALAAGGDTIDVARTKVMGMLDAPDEETRVQAILGLGTLGAVEAVPRLIELVTSDNERIRKAAIETLGDLRRTAIK